MNKEETKNIIHQILDFIDGTEDYNEELNCINGHPKFYLLHSKEETEKRIEEFLKTKETFNRYDLYYFTNQIIKYLLGPYDSHTRVMISTKYLPLAFKVIDNNLYITEITPLMEESRYSRVLAINGVDIHQIIKEIERITCYSTKEYLQNEIREDLTSIDVLKSLPSLGSSIKKITFDLENNGKKDKITFDLERLQDYPTFTYKFPPNYTIKEQENIVIVTYNSCQDQEGMNKLIRRLEELEKQEPNRHYIIDLRGNTGGDSRIINPLIEFLKGKEIVTLTDEEVFSSGRMAVVDLEKIGSYFIGTPVATTLSAFGNNTRKKRLEQLGLRVSASTKFFLYNEKQNRSSFDKTTFAKKFPTLENFMKIDPQIFQPDELIYQTIEDLKSKNDSQLNRAIEYLLQKDKKITR